MRALRAQLLRAREAGEGADRRGVFRRLVITAFAMSVVGFFVEWIGDATNRRPLETIGGWIYAGALVLMLGATVYMAVRILRSPFERRS